jgi:hypothetical protein
MKVVINKCYGGFGLSPLAIKRLAELQGRECYFFTGGLDSPYKRVSLEEATKSIFSHAYDVPEISMENSRNNEYYLAHSLYYNSIDRSDPLLIRVVEELGENVNTNYSRLEIIEIPDGIDFEIEEYDGQEWVSESHRTWS